MAEPPVITFAIPYVRNRGYLREAIASVVAQTLTAWELVVVDDASPEPADDVVAEFADSRIAYVRNPSRLGLAGNWNECVRRAAAELVTVLHADDRLRPEYAAAMVASAREHPDAVAVFPDPVIIGSAGEPRRSLPDLAKRLVRRPRADHSVAGDEGLAGLATGNYIFCPSLCYRRAALGEAPFDARWSFVTDLDHLARLLLGGASLRAVRRPLYEYRRHASNETKRKTDDASRFEEELEFAAQLAAQARSKGWHRTERAARRRVLTRAHLAMRCLADAGRLRFTAAGRKARLLGRDLLGRRSPRPPA